ncbi:hypothetical protein ABW19_dt0206820 [Dactylella cylindrospora]|nr:hypothetical protein ABW19_dt0206820 [Dactylella cylindrospora]
MSGLTVKISANRTSTFDNIATPLSATVPKTPTQFAPEFSLTGKVETSKCWTEAKARFRVKVSGMNPRPSEEIVERFLKNNDRIDKTISECENLKSAADRQYDHSTSSRFIGKLLEVLVVVKNIGDPLLQCAPESVSIAWSAISLLISLGVNDLENCGRISEACANIVTIILNCRLYESRYQKKEQNAGDEEAEKIIIENVQELLSMILDFFWYSNRKLRDKKIKRFFKDIFDSKVNEKYEIIITQYKTLRETTELAFQERVMDFLGDIAAKLEDLSVEVKNVLTELQVREKFKTYRKDLKPTDTHQRQFEATLQPLRYGTGHLCQWLFKHKHYQSWERVAPKSVADKDKNPKSSAEGKTDPSRPHEPVEKVVTPNLMYIKGRAGFGKSVMMALAIQRIKSGSGGDQPEEPKILVEDTILPVQGPQKEIERPPVLYFFFKRGDDATQLTARAYSSLLAQLFHENHAGTKDEMEKFMAAIDDYEGKQSGDGRGHSEGEEEKETTTVTISNKDLLKIESIGKAMGKTIYIVIDGIDECTDFEAEGLVGDLIKLGRSKRASFKILMSSREDMNLETQFAKDDEARAKFDPTADHEGDAGEGDPFHCVTHDDTTILTVTKETNSEDMKSYLDASLRQLMKRRLPRMFYTKKSGGRVTEVKSKRLIADINKMVSSIQQKSDGMFTYSAMIITSLDQPSPLSLTERLQNLPDGMDELYSRQLEALTGAERKLVTLALRRIVWSPTDIGTVEIAEEFKQLYLKEHVAGNDENAEDYDDQSVDGSVAGDNPPDNNPDENSDAPSPEQENNQLARRPSLHRANTYPGENPIEKAMRSPEIADTVYHLEGVGRDFFKFSNEKQVIGLIHKSVRDWVEKESDKAAKRDYGIKSIASLFTWDKESDELKLTLPIPKIFVKGQSESMDFQMTVLTHPLFHEVYMPYYPPKEKEEEPEETKEEEESAEQKDENPEEPSSEEGAKNEEEPITQTEVEAESEHILDPEDKAGLKNETSEPRLEDFTLLDLVDFESAKKDALNEKEPLNGDNVAPKDAPNSAKAQIDESAEIEQPSSPAKDKDIVDEPKLGGEGDASVATPAAEGGNEEENNEEDIGQANEDNGEEEANGDEEERGQEEAEGEEGNGGAEDQDDNDEEGSEQESDHSNETFHQGPWRCEIHQWPHHMKRVAELWPRDERHGEKWTELKDLMGKLSDPMTFRRWNVQYRQWCWDESIEEASDVAIGVDPIHMASYLGLVLYVEYLLGEEELKADPGKLTPRKRHVLHYEDILYFPETVELILKKGVDLNIKDEDDDSPLNVLLVCDELTQCPIERDSQNVKNLLQTLRLFINNGADLNGELKSGQRPLQAIIAIGDESLFDLIMEKDNPKIDLNLADSSERTALHTLWEANTNLSSELQLSIARKLLDAGANPNAQDCDSKAPFLEAVMARNKEGIELLLDPKYEVNINDEDNEGKTALIKLVSNYHDSDQDTAVNLVNVLLKHGADLNVKDKQMWTALMWAIWYENWDIVKALMAAHAEQQGSDHSYVRVKDINDRTMLHVAAGDRSAGLMMAKTALSVLTPEETKEFLEEKDPGMGRTALHISVYNELTEVMNYLLECGADPLATDSEGDSIGDTFFNTWANNRSMPYHSLKDNLEENNRLYLTMKPKDPENLYLHHAISIGDHETVEKLAKAGIDPLKKDLERWDAFDWAYACGKQELMQTCFPDHSVDYEARKAAAKEEFASITAWDSNRSASQIEIDETGLKCELTDDYDNEDDDDVRFMVAVNHPISPYIPMYYFEVTILTGATEKEMMIGVGLAGESPPRDRMPGWEHQNIMSFGLHGDDGRLFSPDTAQLDHQSRVYEAGPATYGVGDVVGCGYDTINHTVFWTLNGKYLGVGFEDVHHRLYPCVGTKRWFTATANFGADPEKPLLWNGSREVFDIRYSS